jgi:hypothetical protein
MAWQDPTEIRVASFGEIYIAPVGTALPTTATGSLNAAFVGLGFVTTDGVALSVAPEIQEIASWQSRTPTRRELISQTVTATFVLQQFDENTVPFAFGGGTVTNPSGSNYRYELPTSGSLDERAMIIDAVDGSIVQRWIIPRGSVTDAVETSFQRTQESQLPISFAAAAPADGSTSLILITNDSASFVAGS